MTQNHHSRQAQAVMHALVLEKPGHPLVFTEMPIPVPQPGQVLVKVLACGICRTDLHIIDGELPAPKLPLVPGHEIVGEVIDTGEAVTQWKPGDIVGIPWLAYTCGKCRYCLDGQENLCDAALFTGYTMNGGYAEYTTAFADYCVAMPAAFSNYGGAPLLCAGLIGYRCYNMAGPSSMDIGLYGFGAAAHIIAQVAVQQGKRIYAFTKPYDFPSQSFAKSLGAVWAGDAGQKPPCQLDAAIIFASAGELVVKALADTRKGGRVVCGGIHMSDIPAFSYDLLWGERSIQSVANLARTDSNGFMQLAGRISLHTEVTPFPLRQGNEALDRVRKGELKGAAVLVNRPA